MNFACLQQTGDFCQTATPTDAQLHQQIDDLTHLAIALRAQSAALPAVQQALVQTWLDQVKQRRLQLMLQLGMADDSSD
jgi:hypothetical protein